MMRKITIAGTFLLLFFAGCRRRETLLEKISSSRSGITFNNRITENDSLNPLNAVNIYNGGGVGVGDFNNDGRPDLYFTGSMVAGKMYLNRGDFHFEDITDRAGVDGMGRWGRGVAVVDINNDGLADLYICNTLLGDSLRRRNILYVNQGAGKDGIPRFKDMAADYGLEAGGQSTMASFFDYDNDGDLDMYLTVNAASNRTDPSQFRQSGHPLASMGRLFRNDMDSSKGHPVFTDVSKAAGITFEGFGHAATVADINGDGWKDIYVSDDFLSNNLLYINNRDGTFSEKSKEYFRHTAYNAMGQDIADVNNDGLPDVVELDMNPEDNYRKKMMLAAGNYEVYKNFDFYGYQYQYVRNMLQLNQGPAPGPDDSVGIPVFSETGFLSGISQTDWSWTPLLADFDNDGFRDLIVTNGFPRDVTDHDFIAYRQRTNGLTNTGDLLAQIPRVKLHSYAFHNRGDATFSDETVSWGLSEPTFSNGAAWVDLDGDGALDVVVNNINDEAHVYRNTAVRKDSATARFLDIRFHGGVKNRNGLGAVATLYYGRGAQQTAENNPFRGYLSSMEDGVHFGLGKTAVVDSVVIRWYNGKKQVLANVRSNQVITANIDAASVVSPLGPSAVYPDGLFRDITRAAGITYRNYGTDFVDFGIQALLPHKLTEYCPAVAVGDLDGNGLDDMIVGGDAAFPAQVLSQQPDGRFIQKEFPVGVSDPSVRLNYKDEGILVFDADGDGKPDIYITGGGYRLPPGSAAYQDRLYVNDGRGNFHPDTLALPVNRTSKLCVRSLDYNNDGRPDLFISGRVDPWNYPAPVSSFIYRNDSEKGKIRFTDVTREVAPMLTGIGLVCDALVSDFNGDGQPDLVLAGEWMPVTFLRNDRGRFTDVTAGTGAARATGWWNSIVGGDFRHTGRTDYVVGNLGRNSLFQASGEYPVAVTAKRFDQGEVSQPILSLFLKDSSGEKREFPEPGRDEISRQFPSIKKRYPDYRSFAVTPMDKLLTPAERKGALRLQATMLQSCFLRNDGNGKFTVIPLPTAAQTSVVNGMLVDDFDGDGNPDLLLCGNDYGTNVSIGRYDAMSGLLLKGDGGGGFKPLSLLQSGVYIPGDGKALVKLRGAGNRYLVAASQHRGVLKLFALKKPLHAITVAPGDVAATLRLRDGRAEKQELNQAGSFLSQSGRFLSFGDSVVSIRLTARDGTARDAVISDIPARASKFTSSP